MNQWTDKGQSGKNISIAGVPVEFAGDEVTRWLTCPAPGCGSHNLQCGGISTLCINQHKGLTFVSWL